LVFLPLGVSFRHTSRLRGREGAVETAQSISTPTIAYVAEGKLYLKREGNQPQLIESPFVQGILDRVERARQNNDWKSSGMAWQFSSRQMSPNAQVPSAETRRIRFSGLSRGGAEGELLYALDTDHVGGLFSLDTREHHERRIFHRNGFVAADLARHPGDGMLALSLRAPDGTASVAVMEAAGKGLRSVTEGDSVDESPSWISSEQKSLLFQSAGVGRNSQGVGIGLGPYAIHRLDVETGNLTTVLEEENNDLLLPRMSADGALHFVRRPYRPNAVSPWRIFTDTLLFPFRVVRAIVHFLDFFSVMFSRKPLLTAGGPRTEGPDARSLMLWGRFIDAEKALRKANQGAQGPLVPADWQLIRRADTGEEQVLAKNVLAYDLCPDGSVIHTNGTAVFHRAVTGDSRQLCAGKMIERVSFAG
jgi:hypothetical protein